MGVGPDTRWVTPSELAEYAYCPRAHYYRRRYGAPPPGRSLRAGQVYHARALGGELRRAMHGRTYWAVIAFGGLLFAVGVLSALGS